MRARAQAVPSAQTTGIGWLKAVGSSLIAMALLLTGAYLDHLFVGMVGAGLLAIWMTIYADSPYRGKAIAAAGQLKRRICGKE